MVQTVDTNTRFKAPVKETLLTPRFYTTDFEEIAHLDTANIKDDLEALMREFRADYNRHHFERDAHYTASAKDLSGPIHQMFVKFLERSCTSEFSGFILYKEIARRLKKVNPLLAEGFHYMSRDEARHAGFLNKTMADFGLALNLPALKKNKKYTFFKPKYIFYSTYLSEKIGYFRYITIFRHLEQHPEFRFHPLFSYFDNWCQDENRHGDFIDLILRSQPHLLKGLNRLWVKFFLTAVFVTMYLNDHKDHEIYDALGLDPTLYAKEVLVRTNREAGKAFPVILNMDEQFWGRMDACLASTLKLMSCTNPVQKLPHVFSVAWNYFKIWQAQPIETSVRTVQ